MVLYWAPEMEPGSVLRKTIVPLMHSFNPGCEQRLRALRSLRNGWRCVRIIRTIRSLPITKGTSLTGMETLYQSGIPGSITAFLLTVAPPLPIGKVYTGLMKPCIYIIQPVDGYRIVIPL